MQKRVICLSSEVDFACKVDGYAKFVILGFRGISTYSGKIIELQE